MRNACRSDQHISMTFSLLNCCVHFSSETKRCMRFATARWDRTGLAIPVFSIAKHCKKHDDVPDVHVRVHERVLYERCVCHVCVTYLDRSFRLNLGRWAVELVPSKCWAKYIIAVLLKALKVSNRLTSQHATAARGSYTHSVSQRGPASKEANWKPARSMAAE